MPKRTRQGECISHTVTIYNIFANGNVNTFLGMRECNRVSLINREFNELIHNMPGYYPLHVNISINSTRYANTLIQLAEKGIFKNSTIYLKCPYIISLGAYYTYIVNKLFILINENIVSMKLLHDTTIRNIEFPILENLILHECSISSNQDFKFLRTSKLKGIDISYSPYIDLDILAYTPDIYVVIALNNTIQEWKDSFTENLVSCKKIEKLTFSCMDTIPEEQLLQICSIPTLRYLDIDNVYIYSSRVIQALKDNKQLTYLSIPVRKYCEVDAMTPNYKPFDGDDLLDFGNLKKKVVLKQNEYDRAVPSNTIFKYYNYLIG